MRITCPINACVIIVTYHPSEDFIKKISKIISHISRVFIIDNGSNPTSLAMLEKLYGESKIKITHNQQNMGVAYALNQGMSLAITQQYEWCLLLDQDSTLDDNILPTLQETYNTIANKDHIGIISAHFISPMKIGSDNAQKNKAIFIEQKICITSGSLLSVNAYQRTGNFRDDFFIDLVDTEYCLRLRAYGFKIYSTTTALMTHEIGQPTHHTLLGFNINASNHPPFRRYFMARNFILLVKSYIFKEPRQLLTQAKILLIDFMVILLFEDFKQPKLLAIINGIKDGLFNNPPKEIEKLSNSVTDD